MTTLAARRGQAIPEIVLLLLLLALTAAGALATLQLGVASLALPLLAVAVVLAIAVPHDFAVLLAGVAIALEPGAIDFSGDISVLLYELPAGVELPLTVSPLELAITIACISVLVRGRPMKGLRLPLVAALVPLCIAAGFVQGWRNGGDMNLGYNEARGLIYGALAFVVAATSPPATIRRLQGAVLIGAGILAAVVLFRYFAFVKPGDLEIPIEFAFAHEDSIMLGVGLVCAATFVLRPSLSLRDRILLVAYILLVACALAATQRRAATLVGLVALASVGAFVFMKRPVLVIALAVPLLLAFVAYLSAYWNSEYGTLAQPARAVRSQIDPSPRDQSSDLYRDIERANVIETVRLNRLLGVGFGRPFGQFQGMPNLESFWPLQFYTPHQNVLWLWLKLGLVGIAAFLALIALALSRCFAVIRQRSSLDDRATLAVVVSATLLMYLAFATVDLALIGTRGALPLAVALAVAFRLPRESAVERETP